MGAVVEVGFKPNDAVKLIQRWEVIRADGKDNLGRGLPKKLAFIAASSIGR